MTSEAPTTAAPPAPARSGAWRRYAGLARVLAGREFVGSFRGNWSGAATTFVVPLLMLGTYTFVFSTLIPVRIRPEQSEADYALFLFSALIVWNGIADVAMRGPRFFTDNRHYVQRADFPISVLVASACLAQLYRALPWLAAYAAAHLWLMGGLPPAALLAPLALLWMLATAFGVGLTLAALGVWVREARELTPPLFTLLFFVSPVLYPSDRLRSVHPALADWNPFASGIELARLLLFEGALPSPELLLRSFLAAAVFLAIGALAHRAVRPRLPDLA